MTTIKLARGLRMFKPCYRDRDGQRRIADAWYIEFRDHSRRVRRLPAFADKAASAELARKTMRLVNWKANGELPDVSLQSWIDTMPDKLRATLARWDILDDRRIAASLPLSDHLDDWKAALLAKGVTPRHAELVTSRARKVMTGCAFKTWSDVSASRVQTYLAELREDRKAGEKITRGIGNQTSNFYLSACNQFARWLAKDRRASDNPLAHLDGLNIRTDRRHDRRALLVDELRWLLDVTERGDIARGMDPIERFGMSGAERALLYRLAVETGLRAGELRSLTRASFDLAADEPAVTIAAAYAKNRRQDNLPLRAETAALLADHFRVKLPDALAFAMPKRTEGILMFRADLSDARAAWLATHRNAQERSEADKSAFLAYVDDAGRHADFHALRHTFISNLAAGGVHPKTAQQLARHSTITLTMDRYTHSYRGDLSAALDVLPDLSVFAQPQAQAATGTHDAEPTADALACCLARLGGESGDERSRGGLTTDASASEQRETRRVESPVKSAFLTHQAESTTIGSATRRSGRAVECAGLENR